MCRSLGYLLSTPTYLDQVTQRTKISTIQMKCKVIKTRAHKELVDHPGHLDHLVQLDQTAKGENKESLV